MNSKHGAFDIVIAGCGAAGMAAGIFAAQLARGRDLRILIIEGAKTPGAKILVSGGGRCNVTNERVTPEDYWGGSRAIIRNVIAQFDDSKVRDWFADMGVELKLEPTGKYFPVSNQAQTVLDALMNRLDEVGVKIWTGTRVVEIVPVDSGFSLTLSDAQVITARKVIVATGGMALPKSGSDGAGLSIMQKWGHTIVPTTPALTPLVLGADRTVGGRFAEFAGITMDARMQLRHRGRGKPIIELEGSLLFTHFGLSGPVAMNLSRHWLRERLAHPEIPLEITLGHPRFDSTESASRWLLNSARQAPSRHLSTVISELYPERVAHALVQTSGPEVVLGQLSADRRRILAEMISALPVNVVGTRDYHHAEAMAGGIELSEVDYRTMQSRKVPGLYLCGEILDVDGRIGGFNFQWAWSSGYVAGRGAAASLAS